MLLLQTCGTAAKIDGSYQEKLLFFYYQTLIYMIAVNLNRTTLLNSVKFAKKLAVMKK
jgi:hypothetical protein